MMKRREFIPLLGGRKVCQSSSGFYEYTPQELSDRPHIHRGQHSSHE
jgi:hypothetical protein